MSVLRSPASAALLLTTLLSGCASTPAPVNSPEPARPAPPKPAPVVKPATPPTPPRPAAKPAPAPPQAPIAPPISAPTVVSPAPVPIHSSYMAASEGIPLVTRLLPAYVKDKTGWATDLFTAFRTMQIPPKAENFCAAMAIIEQESTFQADPVVPGLSKIVWKQIDERRQKYGIPMLVIEAALLKKSSNGKSYKERIDSLKTEKQMSDLIDDMIAEIPNGQSWLSAKNPVRTGGPMQVSVEFAEQHIKERAYPYQIKGNLRNEVFSRRGGVYFGVANLLDYPANYSHMQYRFADFNAGRYSSRNAAFQYVVSTLSRQPMEFDGDLLRYKDGKPSGEVGTTQKILFGMTQMLGMSPSEMQRDLLQEKTLAFESTPLYQKVFAIAEQHAGRKLLREMLPGIDLKSPKIQRKLTTAWFAQRVTGRYQTCLQRAGQ